MKTSFGWINVRKSRGKTRPVKHHVNCSCGHHSAHKKHALAVKAAKLHVKEHREAVTQ